MAESYIIKLYPTKGTRHIVILKQTTKIAIKKSEKYPTPEVTIQIVGLDTNPALILNQRLDKKSMKQIKSP